MSTKKKATKPKAGRAVVTTLCAWVIECEERFYLPHTRSTKKAALASAAKEDWMGHPYKAIRVTIRPAPKKRRAK